MTRHVRKLWPSDELPELIDAAEAVERMLGSPGWQIIERVLGAEVATIDSELDHGSAKEAADYAKQHGRRSALLAAGEAARAVIGEADQRRVREEERQASGAGESVPERMAA